MPEPLLLANIWDTLAAPFTDNPQSAAWVIAIGAMTNVACAVLGCFLILRRMSLMGDALSHAVLPGLVVAFMLTGSLDIKYMFAGALVVGVLTTFFTQWLHRQGVTADASMGVVFTSLFALGVVLIGLNRQSGLGQVHLDIECVLEGELAFVARNTRPIGGIEVPIQLLVIGPVLLLNLVCVGLFWKEFKISSFDPALSTTMGFNANLLHYLLMTLVALTTVAAFQAVGTILVVAMLIAPPATAHLVCDRLSRMLLVASLLAIVTAVIGYWLAAMFNISIAPMMAVVAGSFYGIAVLFSPRYGVVSALVRNLQTSTRILREDVLAMLYRLEELAADRLMGPREAVRAVGGGLLGNWGLRQLVASGEVQETDAGLRLTDSGRQHATQLVRSHRLWEAYLVHHLGLPSDHVHDPAMRMEHYIDEGLRKEISEQLPETAVDPHGRGIPEV